jgi:hypothetical protein
MGLSVISICEKPGFSYAYVESHDNINPANVCIDIGDPFLQLFISNHLYCDMILLNLSDEELDGPAVGALGVRSWNLSTVFNDQSLGG